MRIASHAMSQALRHQLEPGFLGGRSELAQQRLRGHLQKAPTFYPTLQLGRTLPQDRIPLRMDNDRPRSRSAQSLQDLAAGFGDQQIAELHQQIASMRNGVS